MFAKNQRRAPQTNGNSVSRYFKSKTSDNKVSRRVYLQLIGVIDKKLNKANDLVPSWRLCKTYCDTVYDSCSCPKQPSSVLRRYYADMLICW